jgi:hypothetical protein
MLFIAFLCMLFCNTVKAENKQLSDQESTALFNDAVIKTLGIPFPIFRVYECNDKSGKSYCIMTEHVYKQQNNKPLMDTIKAYYVIKANGGYKIVWRLQDFIDYERESSIWFWTKYSRFEDLNSDGYIDPVVVYGTSGDNGLDDGRLKILVYFKNKKFAVRHQNGVLDFERNTRIDSAFYLLPGEIINSVTSIMKNIIDNDQAIFPNGWEKAMDGKKTYIEERADDREPDE